MTKYLPLSKLLYPTVRIFTFLKLCTVLLLCCVTAPVHAQTTWYSYQSGNWTDTDWRTWTTDPSGTTLINPLNLQPGATDDVVILNGRTVIIPTGTTGRTVASVTIQEGAVLDITNTTGHSFGSQLNGSGLLRLSTANFPSFASGSFVQPGGGTVEYRNMGSFTFSQVTYNNLILTLNNSTDEALFVNTTNPFIINGNVTIDKGLLRISNNSNNIALDVYFNGDVVVNQDGGMGVGNRDIGSAANQTGRSHQIYVKGSLYNYGGTVLFTNMTAPDYNSDPPGGGVQAGWSDVIFNNDEKDQNIVCNGTTVFYRIEINKGTDQTYILHIDASDPNNFLLYGRNDRQGSIPTNNLNALGLVAGTVRVGYNIVIPCLATDSGGSGRYVVFSEAQLWFDGSTVTFTTTSAQTLIVYGKARFSSGCVVDFNNIQGIITRVDSELEIENGTITSPCLRASVIGSGTEHRGAFKMYDGTLTLTGNINVNQHASFSLPYPSNVFVMSGGTIDILSPTIVSGGSGTNFSFIIGAQSKNINVTGGSVVLHVPDTRNAYVTTTAPFNNLLVTGNTDTRSFQVRDFSGNPSGPYIPSVDAQPLICLGNLNFENFAIFDNTAEVDVFVRGDFTIGSSASYIPGNNTTTFNNNESQNFDIQGSVTGSLNHLSLSNASRLTLNNSDPAVPVVVKGNLQIDSGCIFIDNGRILQVQGDITNSGLHFKPMSGAGNIQLTGTAAQTIYGNGQGIFNNLILNKTGGSVTIQNDLTLTGHLRLANTAARLNLGYFNLLLTETADIYDNITGTGKNFSETRMIQTNGLVSDGGISKVYNSTGAFLFPFGFYHEGSSKYYYLPASIRFSGAPASYGTVTTRPVNTRHPLAQSTNSLTCYWKTESNGFMGVPTGSVVHNYTYDPLSNDFVSGNEGNYVPSVYRNTSGASWTMINNPVLVNDGTNTITYDTAYMADGEYTAGETDAFAAIPVRYSTGADGDWSHPVTWSSVAVGGPGGASVPDANTLVIIGNDTLNHTVTIYEDSKMAGSLTISSGSILDLRNTVGHTFEAIPDKGVAGTGKLRIASNNYFPQGDFGDFIGEAGGTVEYYTIAPLPGSITIPTVSDVTGLQLDHYYNLIISPVSTTTITFPDTDLTIHNDLTKSDAGHANTSNAAVHSVFVNGSFNANDGVFEIQNTNMQTITVMGDLNVGGEFRVQNSAAVDHVLQLHGSLNGTGIFNLNNGAGIVFTYFLGADDASINGNIKSFYSLEVNKGYSQLPVLNVRAPISISSSFDPALTLRNGTIRIKQGNLSLSSNRSFTIPESACLSIDSVANITVVDNNSNDSTLFLIGRLEVLSGTLNIGNMAYIRRNCIEYSSEGKPEIIIRDGILNVNGQIKRNSLTTQGALRFEQSGGTLNIYGKNDDDSRAKFEICSNNSSFTMSEGMINIYRGGGVNFGDFYLRPQIWNVTGGTVNLGPGSAIGAQTYQIDASCNLHHLSIAGFNGANTATANIMVNPLDLTGDLIIDGFGTLDCNNKIVSVEGNFTNNGNYLAGTNTTVFKGENDAAASFGVNTTFHKLIIDKSSGSAVTFSTGGSFQPTVNDSLTIDNGILINSDNLNIIALGNIINNGIHSSTGAGNLVIQGTKNQVISGNGSGQYGNMNISNGAANGVTLTADITINGILTLTTGYFYIDRYLVTLGSTASIGGTPGNPVNNNWIVTNGVLSDAGIKKVFPAISPASFTFPVGVIGKYTPVSYNLTYTAASPGSITLKPVNDKIPSLTNGLSDELQYYWHVSSTPFGGLSSATHTYNYLQGDVTGTEANYVGARYYNFTWTDLGTTVINAAANTITPIGGYIDGEYTCGEPGNFLNKPVYYSYDLAPNITTTGADWNTAGSWATGGHNGTVASVPPDGNPIIIKSGHRINVADDDRYSYSVENSGILDLGFTTGHNLGHVSGNGRIIMTNTLAGQFVFPGGDFSAFMNTTGSTIEYNGDNGAMPSVITPVIAEYQNLEFTGPITKNMSCVNILVKGNLSISESQLSNTLYNKNITIWGDWNDAIADGFIPGKGLVAFEGTALQTISSPDTEHFYNFRMNNPAEVSLSGDAEIAKMLYLTEGKLNTTYTNLLTITSSSPVAAIGGSDASYVDGPLSKYILNGQYFNFPVGDYNASASKASRFGNVRLSNVSANGFWQAEYVNDDPDPVYSTSSLLSPITSVSDNEYWIITRPGPNTANVRLRWDDYSGIASVNSTRVCEWVTPANRWEEKGSLASGTLSAGTVSTQTPVTTDSYVFTLGVSGVTARITDVSPSEICNNGEIVTVTVVLTGTPDWTLSYNAGSSSYVQSGIGSSVYTIQLTGTDFGGPGVHNIQLTAVSDISGPGYADLTVYPVTVKETYIPDIQGTFTVGAGEVRNYYTTSHSGSSYAWSWQGASGGSIASPISASTDITITTPAVYPSTYQLQIIETTSNGCTASDVQSITVLSTPSPDITPDNPNQCFNNVVIYSTPLISGHTYTWTVTGGIPATGTGNTITVTWNTIGNGSVSVLEDNSGITGSDIVNVVIDPQPNTGLAVTAPPSVCLGNISNVTVSSSQSGFNYQLRNDGDDSNVGTAIVGTGGDINLPTGPLTIVTTFNVLVYNNGCSDELAQMVTIDINDPAAPTGPASQSFCAVDNPTVANLVANGSNIQWYDVPTGSTPLAGTSLLITADYYASQTVGGCESSTRLVVAVTVDDPAPPTGPASQSFCAVDNPTVANLIATGNNIQWYDVSTGGIPLAGTIPLITGDYYASQTVGGCESDTRLTVAVTVNDPAAPTGNASQNYCALDNPTVNNLVATGSNIQWYNVPTGGVPLAGTTPLTTGIYYASQTVSGCESDTRLAVSVTVTDPSAPTGPASQSFCAIDNPTVGNLVATGSNIQWYDVPTGGTPLAVTASLLSGNYYASQTINGCESPARLAVSVMVSDPSAPTGPADQDFCMIDNPIIDNLQATGSNIMWYDVATGGVSLPGATPLATGNYYASQTVSGCESDTRLAVAVEVGTTPVTSSISGNTNPICNETGVSYSVVLTAGSTYAWTVPPGAVVSSGETGPDNNLITVDFGSQDGLIEVVETSSLGCTGNAVQLAVVLQGCNLESDFAADDTVLCLGESVVFTDLSQGTIPGTTYQWDFGEGAIPATANTAGPHVVQYTNPGNKTIQLTVTNIASDIEIKTDYIQVHDNPFIVMEDVIRCGPGDVVFNALLSNGDHVDFSLDNGLTIATGDDTDPYQCAVFVDPSSSVEVWARGYNTVAGCYGDWSSSAFGFALVVPITPKIQAADAGPSEEGYVDVVCAGEEDALYYINGTAGVSYNWNIPGLGILINDTTQVEIDWNAAAGDYVIEVQAVSKDGCPGAISDTLVLVSQPDPDLGGDVSICGDESYTFTLQDQYAQYLWHDFSENPTFTALASGEVSVTVWDDYSCTGSDTAYLAIHPNPTVNLGNDTILCHGNLLVLDAGNFSSYLWSTGETVNPITVSEGAGTVWVTVTDENGCQAYDDIVILECDPVIMLGDIPNTFTPNNDQIHDSWVINNIYLFPDASIKVFDRWGRLVFEVDGGYENDWYGKGPNGNDLPVDTYYYIIDLGIPGSEPITGTVSIIR